MPEPWIEHGTSRIRLIFSLLLSQLSYSGDEGRFQLVLSVWVRREDVMPTVSTPFRIPASTVYLLIDLGHVWTRSAREHLSHADGVDKHQAPAQGRADRALAARKEEGRPDHSIPGYPAQSR